MVGSWRSLKTAFGVNVGASKSGDAMEQVLATGTWQLSQRTNSQSPEGKLAGVAVIFPPTEKTPALTTWSQTTVTRSSWFWVLSQAVAPSRK